MIARTPHPPRRVLAFCAMFFALSAAACGGGADHPAGGFQYDESANPDTDEEETQEPVATDGGAPTTTCIEGATQECKITLPSQGSVKNCVTGFQFCEQGQWTECDPDPM